MNIGPFIKEELKQTILSRRHRIGLTEIVLDDKKPTVKRGLTEEEVQKKLRRKEQNRRAAEKCRQKKKKINEKLMIEFDKEQQKNEIYQQEIELLRKEAADLQRILDEHPCTMAKTPNETPAFDDRTSFTFPYDTCLTPSHQQESDPHWDTQTPFQQDTLDDFNDLSDLLFLPPDPSKDKNICFNQPGSQSTFTEFLTDISLSDDFDVYQLLVPPNDDH